SDTVSRARRTTRACGSRQGESRTAATGGCCQAAARVAADAHRGLPDLAATREPAARESRGAAIAPGLAEAGIEGRREDLISQSPPEPLPARPPWVPSPTPHPDRNRSGPPP